MKKIDLMDNLLIEGNGYLFTKDVVAVGISKPYLNEYVKKRGLERVAHGVYLAPNEWKDDLYLLYLKNQKIVFSHETALYLHGLMEREPSKINVTVKQGYNATHLRNQGVRVFQIRENRMSFGRTEVKTSFGNMVAVYDKERTLCDIVANKEKMDLQVFQTALKEYAQGKDKQLNNLMEYAFLFGVEEDMRRYTEVLL